MAKGPFITEDMRSLITQVHQENPDFVAKEVKAKVDRLSDGKGPGLSAIQKELTKIHRKHQQKVSAQEKLWSLGLLSEPGVPDLPADSIPVLLEIQAGRIKREESPLSVREAKWVARLYRLTSDPTELSIWAQFYAARELACETAGVAFDTGDMDLGIIYGKLPGMFIRWMAFSDIVSDSEKKDNGDELAHRLEETLLGRRLESLELTGKALWWYIYQLVRLTENSQWAALPKEKQELLVLRIQDYISQHQEDRRHPTEIYEEFGIRPKHETKI